jgi:malate synthase
MTATSMGGSGGRLPTGVQIAGPSLPGRDEILTPEAVAFVGHLQRTFGSTRAQMLERRGIRQAELVPLEGGAGDAPLTADRYGAIRAEELARLRSSDSLTADRLGDAAALLDQLVLADDPIEFLTLPAYPLLVRAAAG